MKTSFQAVLADIGPALETKITNGRYGDTTLHGNGYLFGDPCYWMDNDTYRSFCAAAFDAEPEAYSGRCRDWVCFQWHGNRAFFKTVSDGNASTGHCVDSGWIAAAIPTAWEMRRFRNLTPRSKGVSSLSDESTPQTASASEN